ncbi:peptidase domain-containing ABC transporter [Thermoleptolyngbya oregonensis NK1-22]|uniref:Peptidase domain-containing ABC transporter n=1 Tax=Thermoleptolyngbya oregonensis NK1-22 TaxID=2547457 RepID=A0AA97BKN2_9CYAN|nr:type I secretion system permease/ATPase [Thermoleptolyngbya oregonensis]WOB42132.1 peptidase domain-containing ABC transporter [Thermoleptolyngbya oregonensis NK1-22]
MTFTQNLPKETVQEFLATVFPFTQLSSAALARLLEQVQPFRYKMGQAILVREKMPAQVTILYEGQARSLGYDPRTDKPTTLGLLQPGAVLGAVSLMRGVACETAIASEESICLTLPARVFLDLLEKEPAVASALSAQAAPIEVFDLLGEELSRQADGTLDLKALTHAGLSQAEVRRIPPGTFATHSLQRDRLWLVSSGEITGYPVGSRLNLGLLDEIEVTGEKPARLVSFPLSLFRRSAPEAPQDTNQADATLGALDIPYAPERPEELEPVIIDSKGKAKEYPIVRGRGQLEATMACFQMLCQHLNLPFRRDVVRRILVNQMERTGGLPLDLCGAIAEFMGLSAQLVTVPAQSVGRLEAPAMVRWQDRPVLLYSVSEREMVIADPELGLLRRKPSEFAATWGEQGDVLLLRATKQTPQKRFNLSWFLPSVTKYRGVLLLVFLASFFVQLFALANPLMIQVIIDKVIVQNSPDTLQVLGILLLLLAFFEALLGALRTYLFVDTTNRIDMTLGSQIIDHLLRLPLRYFEKRPVGELSTRIGELENIRSFMTGTALTVVLDAFFSVVYIVVMLFYSPLLTLVALATIPFFIALAVIFSPIIRNQLRVKAERNAETQSYLVEVLGGIQTVKAQNMELRSRWQWQQRYARYVSAGFTTVQTSTFAGSLSNFLNQLSGLLVLWVGAYLVLKQELSLGQLIAFRIIAGYVTSPLLRLAQLWQNFQEVGLSIERLSDIVDSAPEADELDRLNIPMPPIQGEVAYENVSFRFGTTGPLQLSNINLEFAPGSFVGIVGQSGSGKSTLMKLLPRLYDLESGRILIDGYDITKVELYSLRQQIGIVPQDTLLFDGTVQENIALNAPDASAEEIIEAAKVAAAHEFIMGLPNGYNTRVGERGASLSGGQRQRIAIARTVMQNPRLLIMDEATSALDYDSERRVCMNLAEHFRGRTVFFITHRLSTIRHADLILMMDQGSVVEQGTHEDLMAMRGRYYCLYQQQEAQL